jgi:O-6-methylguanine DNA methyltransferase
LKAAKRWLKAYAAGTIETLPMLVLVGKDFQCRVWEALLAIPPGKTWSYRDVARAVGSPRAYRAVGQAVGANPLALMIPCHRVIGSSGKLVGFGAGLQLKKELLKHEN